MAFPAPARPRRAVVCFASLFILTTIFLAATRMASSLEFALRRRPTTQEAPKRSPADAPMSYGSAARPAFTDLSVQIATLPEQHLPSRANPGHRLVIVGDVHGMRASLDKLLEELRFDTSRGDHLVLAGDMINKGPDSRGVIDLAMRLGASAVRGNHEDRVLLAHRSMQTTHVADEDAHGNPVTKREEGAEAEEHKTEEPKTEEPKTEEPKTEDPKPEDHKTEDPEKEDPKKEDPTPEPESADDKAAATAPEAPEEPEEPEQDDLEPTIFPHGDSRERATARALSRKHRDWLSTLPVILDVGSVEGLGNLVVVHAGLVPGLPLRQQDPWAVMNMRGLVYPREELRRQEARRVLEDYRKIHTAAPDVTETMVEREHERRRKPGDRGLAIPTDRHDGASSWPRAWNALQRGLPEAEPRTAVAYGHDSKRGLSIDKYTFGLDSGCVNGGELSALVIEATAEGVTHAVKSVKCDKDGAKGRKKHKKSEKKKKETTADEEAQS
ncbi:Calcineurin-like phosphoesterase [Colletotrichum higginsianum IMI 349063]|uniref:Calcineurin-like phosphoesterase n=2 Tax=Colletotrichum higginsianum TaxID=80884 RepID=A0A1B7Y987_COLHI|nr:Calcineurin-like phosphoesterase [Colletotrichum higginsianum IMI 349063]OBR08418.1 Calcineurin-like phosphoesterase [Colletotrichum higginsianum IMI 349063]TIC95659.1 Serine/threonine-protein phosphatase 1 [Colletotrichum higginsianum]